MVDYNFINFLTASRGAKSETVSGFRTDEKWAKRTTLPQTNCSRRTLSPPPPPPPQILSHTRQGRIGSTKVLSFNAVLTSSTVIGLALPYGSQLKSSIYLSLIQATLKFAVCVQVIVPQVTKAYYKSCMDLKLSVL